MRQFVLAGAPAYNTEPDISKVPTGAIGFIGLVNGVSTAISDGTEIKGPVNLVLGDLATGIPTVLPFFPHHFRYTKSVYIAGVKFSGEITIPALTTPGDIDIILVKKGQDFNQRSNFTASTYLGSVAKTPTQIAADLAKRINQMTPDLNVTAVAAAAKITITGKEFDDYQIVPAGLLIGVVPANVVNASKPQNDATAIKALYMKAVADRGITNTCESSVQQMYPSFPLDPLATPGSADTGFTVFTLFFSERRYVKTLDENVNQIVQVAFKTGATAITAFENVLKGLSGEEIV